MNKLDYIVRQLSRAEKKKYEHYVVTRIWHLLNDLSIKIITQQYVNRNGKKALTDLYFPQFKLHIEIDEGHHKKRIELDKIRELDIINATGHLIERIDVTVGIEKINERISEVVKRIKEAKKNSLNFIHWDLASEFNPKTYIKKGKIELIDDCMFRTMVDAANCFGHNIKPNGIWRGGVKHPKEPMKIIWFPKLYKNKKWNNSISDDEMQIREICEDKSIASKHITEVLKKGYHKRIVFARVKGPLGDIMYRFKGEFEIDRNETNTRHGILWRRIASSVKTYST